VGNGYTSLLYVAVQFVTRGVSLEQMFLAAAGAFAKTLRISNNLDRLVLFLRTLERHVQSDR
jgi:hypothetical protein